MSGRDLDFEGISKSEIIDTFVRDLVAAGQDSEQIGHALADVWLALPEEID